MTGDGGIEASGLALGRTPGTPGQPHQLLRFPARRLQQAWRQERWAALAKDGAARVARAYNALDAAMEMAASAYGVTVTWDSDAHGQRAADSPFPDRYLVAGDARHGRLLLSPSGLAALALVRTLGHGCGACGETTCNALAGALRTLTAQACAILDVAARIAWQMTHIAGRMASAAAATTEWVIAVPSSGRPADGGCEIVTLPTLAYPKPRQRRASVSRPRARRA